MWWVIKFWNITTTRRKKRARIKIMDGQVMREESMLVVLVITRMLVVHVSGCGEHMTESNVCCDISANITLKSCLLMRD
eukprot:m.40957 g.40957  ORF g.40957 m.40957 type:complete len:79 (-) comp10490_c0_seq1:114-350(-)